MLCVDVQSFPESTDVHGDLECQNDRSRTCSFTTAREFPSSPLSEHELCVDVQSYPGSIDIHGGLECQNDKNKMCNFTFAEEFPSSPLSAHELVIDLGNSSTAMRQLDNENSMDSIEATSGVSENYTSSHAKNDDTCDMYDFSDDLASDCVPPVDASKNLYDLLLIADDDDELLNNKTLKDDQSDLYDDLLSKEIIDQEENLKTLQEKHLLIINENQNLSHCVQQITEELHNVQMKNNILVRNISSLFQTAKLEIERKNSEIDSLRQELDNFIFRRTFKPKLKGRLKTFKEPPNVHVSANSKSKNCPKNEYDVQEGADSKMSNKITTGQRQKDNCNADFQRLFGYQGKKKLCNRSIGHSTFEKLPKINMNSDAAVDTQNIPSGYQSACKDSETCKWNKENQNVNPSVSKNHEKRDSVSSPRRLLCVELGNCQTKSSDKERPNSESVSSFVDQQSYKTNRCLPDQRNSELKTNLPLKENLLKPSKLSSFLLNDESFHSIIKAKESDPVLIQLTETNLITSNTSVKTTLPYEDKIANCHLGSSSCEDAVKDTLLDILQKVEELNIEQQAGLPSEFMIDAKNSFQEVIESNNVKNISKGIKCHRNFKIDQRVSKESPRKKQTRNYDCSSNKHSTTERDSSHESLTPKTECRRSPRKHQTSNLSNNSANAQQKLYRNEPHHKKLKYQEQIRSSPRKVNLKYQDPFRSSPRKLNNLKMHNICTPKDYRSGSLVCDVPEKVNSDTKSKCVTPKKNKIYLPKTTQIQSKNPQSPSRTSPRSKLNSKRFTPKKTPRTGSRSSPRKRTNSNSNVNDVRVQRDLFTRAESSPQRKRAKHETERKGRKKDSCGDSPRKSGHNKGKDDIKISHNNSRKKLLMKYKCQSVTKKYEPSHVQKLSFIRSKSVVRYSERNNINRKRYSRTNHKLSPKSNHKKEKNQDRGSPRKRNESRKHESNSKQHSLKNQKETEKGKREPAKNSSSFKFDHEIKEFGHSGNRSSNNFKRVKENEHTQVKKKHANDCSPVKHHVHGKFPLNTQKSENHVFTKLSSDTKSKCSAKISSMSLEGTLNRNNDKMCSIASVNPDVEEGEILSD